MFQLLIVDDEPSVTTGLVRKIDWPMLGIDRVHCAVSAQKALELLQIHPIDIVITDIRMPGMDGLELLERIRAAWPRIKCLLLTGYADFAYAQRAIRCGSSGYLLKPVGNEELHKQLTAVVEQLRREWEELTSSRNATRALREHLPLLRGNLLSDLLLGRRVGGSELREKLATYQLPFAAGDAVALLLVRLEHEFEAYDFHDLSLMEYAVANIAEEIGKDHFDLWHGKDVHDYLVFAVKAKKADSAEFGTPPGDEEELRRSLERIAAQLQHSVRTYLKGSISVVVSRFHPFPESLSGLYHSVISSMRRQIGADTELIVLADRCEFPEGAVQSLIAPYEPPSLIHLLEAAKWEAAEHKINAILRELEVESKVTPEHVIEVYALLISSFSHAAHKNGRYLQELLGEEQRMPDVSAARSVKQLEGWAKDALRRLRRDTERQSEEGRSSIVAKIRSFVETHISEGVNLQSIAGCVHLHPVYLSKLYKQETGENISDYLYRLRMVKAASLLQATDKRIYEISQLLGYQSTHHFISVFKKFYGVTPQDYRAKSAIRSN